MHLNQPLDQTKVPGVYARCPPSAGSCSSCQKPIPNKQKQNGNNYILYYMLLVPIT